MYWVSATLAAIALGFAYYGLNLMYDDSYSNKVVGGDAYNFIIYAARGTAYVSTGVVFAVLSAAAAIVGHSLSDRVAQTDQQASGS